MYVQGKIKLKAESLDGRDMTSNPGVYTGLLLDCGQEILSPFGFP